MHNLILENDSKSVFTTSGMEFEGNWPSEVKQKFINEMTVIDNFITDEEESELLSEIEPYLKRMR